MRGNSGFLKSIFKLNCIFNLILAVVNANPTGNVRMAREIYVKHEVSLHNTSQTSEMCLRNGVQVKIASVICDKKPGCRAIQKTGECCPEFKCDCKKDDRIYENGEKLVDPETPCRVCYCQAGEFTCNSITCYIRNDCEPKFITGRCCPEYDNCPPLENVKLSSSSKESSAESASSSSSEEKISLKTTIKQIATTEKMPIQMKSNGEKSSTEHQPIDNNNSNNNNNPLGIKIKEITKAEEIRITDDKPKVFKPIKSNMNNNNNNNNNDGTTVIASSATTTMSSATMTQPILNYKLTTIDDNDDDDNNSTMDNDDLLNHYDNDFNTSESLKENVTTLIIDANESDEPNELDSADINLINDNSQSVKNIRQVDNITTTVDVNEYDSTIDYHQLSAGLPEADEQSQRSNDDGDNLNLDKRHYSKKEPEVVQIGNNVVIRDHSGQTKSITLIDATGLQRGIDDDDDNNKRSIGGTVISDDEKQSTKYQSSTMQSLHDDNFQNDQETSDSMSSEEKSSTSFVYTSPLHPFQELFNDNQMKSTASDRMESREIIDDNSMSIENILQLDSIKYGNDWNDTTIDDVSRSDFEQSTAMYSIDDMSIIGGTDRTSAASELIYETIYYPSSPTSSSSSSSSSPSSSNSKQSASDSIEMYSGDRNVEGSSSPYDDDMYTVSSSLSNSITSSGDMSIHNYESSSNTNDILYTSSSSSSISTIDDIELTSSNGVTSYNEQLSSSPAPSSTSAYTETSSNRYNSIVVDDDEIDHYENPEFPKIPDDLTIHGSRMEEDELKRRQSSKIYLSSSSQVKPQQRHSMNNSMNMEILDKSSSITEKTIDENISTNTIVLNSVPNSEQQTVENIIDVESLSGSPLAILSYPDTQQRAPGEPLLIPEWERNTTTITTPLNDDDDEETTSEFSIEIDNWNITDSSSSSSSTDDSNSNSSIELEVPSKESDVTQLTAVKNDDNSKKNQDIDSYTTKYLEHPRIKYVPDATKDFFRYQQKIWGLN